MLHNLILFFERISFQTLIFNGKACFKIMPFKISTKSEKLVVVRGANRIKTLFLRRDVFIETWFLNINWTQNLSLRKICLHKMIFRIVFYRNPPGRKTLDSKTDHFVGKNFTSKSDIFFKKFQFKFLIFKEKVYFKIMPFKISAKKENYLVFPGANWVRTFFFSDVNFLSKSDFSIKTELKNWVSGKYSFSRIWLFEKFFIIKSAGTKVFQFTTWNFEKKFISKSHFVGKNLLHNLILFFREFHFKLWISMGRLASKSCPLK